MKVAIVTGSSSGIGFATSVLLARNNFYTYASMRNISKATAIMEIAKKENLRPEEKTIEDELKYLTSNFKDREIDPVKARAFIEHNLRIEKAILFLESQK